MKLTKKLFSVALVAAISASAVTAFAAYTPDHTRTYDELLTDAQACYDAGLYYEAYHLAEAANDLLVTSSTTNIAAGAAAVTAAANGSVGALSIFTPVPSTEAAVLMNAALAQINALETINPAETLSLQFGRVQDLMNSGLYYEAKSLLQQTIDLYLTPGPTAATYTDSNKADVLMTEIDLAIVDYELDYVESLLNSGMYYEAQAEFNTIAGLNVQYTLNQATRYAELQALVTDGVNNVVTTAEMAIAVLENDSNYLERIQYDPDVEFVVEPLYHGQDLVGFGILVESKSTGAYVAGYTVTTSADVIMLGGAGVPLDITYPYVTAEFPAE